MSRCGRCKGRSYIKDLRGLGVQPCPDCVKGIKKQKTTLGANKVSVSIDGASCRVCGEPAVHGHHVVPQERLDRYVLEGERQKAKADRRNIVPLCDLCHGRVHSDDLRLAPHELHPQFPAFVAELDLYAALPRHLKESQAA